MRAGWLLVAALALAGCDWNRTSASFDDYAEYQASDFAARGLLPDRLLPTSARDIIVKYDRVTTLVEAEFAFDPADQEAVVRPFLSFDQLSLRLAVASGAVQGAKLPDPSLLLRCGPGPMEFLQLDRPGHARYWTERDPERRKRACSNGAIRATR